MKKVLIGIIFAVLPVLSGCRPESAFKVALRLEDETTGKPIADAWVVAIADIDYTPLREEPYNKGVAAARGITDPKGNLKLKKLEGIYFGQEPSDQLWLMLESRKPKVDRRITGIRAGSIFIFSKEYGFIHQPFTVTSTAADYAGWADFSGYELTQKTVRLDPQAIAGGKAIAIKVKKLTDADKIKSAFQTEFLAMLKSGMTSKTGATVKEKEALYNFFVRNMKEASETSEDPFYKHEYENLSLPEVKKEVINWDLANAENHDTAVHEWLTRKALELLPGETEEVKQYATAVLAGAKAEDDGLRFYNHFYDPQAPGTGYNGNETALKWGAIGYPDNPKNDWDWEDAKRYYRNGDKEKAYTALGHVAHLLEDLTCPMHTRLIRHATHWDKAARFEAYFNALIKQNAGSLPMEYSLAERPARLKNIQEQFNDTAKLTFGTFTQNGRPVNFDNYYGNRKLIKQPDDETLNLMGGYLFPKTIAQTSGLMTSFYNALHPAASAKADAPATDAGGTNSQQINDVPSSPPILVQASHDIMASTQSCNSDQADKDMEKAAGLDRKKQYAEALMVYRQIAEKCQNAKQLDVARIKIGDMLLKQQKNAEARKEYEKILSADSKKLYKARAIDGLFFSYLQDNEFKKAEDYYNAAINKLDYSKEIVSVILKEKQAIVNKWKRDFPEKKEIKTAIELYNDAIIRKDISLLRSLFSDSIAEARINDIRAYISKNPSETRTLKNIEIYVSDSGKAATAEFQVGILKPEKNNSSSETREGFFKLRKVGGQWKIFE